ncbi:hypothetical protein JK628_10010 [Shewanella sp. KX20019]|uniref:DUF6279 family lipoprotein n=1 Tax=Shewanella sp. KX20019 TaxID=2803864 RepID=UPI0019286E94|nr:DUF6279 family lipoprotein [Shewanella sp. KX20019]QQX82109.1 hypothetical protein JK628_10010 [Shewanella sp. KX20019]
MRKVILWSLLSITLLGCSTKVGYYFLDWAIEWELEEYVSLDDKQDKQFEVALNTFLAWHRAQELPRYKDQLVQLAAEIGNQDFTTQSWNDHVRSAKSHWVRVFDFIEPSLTPLISSFSDEQVEQVIAQLRVEEKELNKKYLGKSQQQLIEMADERIEKRVKKWIGKLLLSQKTAIHNYNVARGDSLDMWLEYRHDWIRLFSQTLKNRQNKIALSHSLTLLMTQPETLKSTAYQAILDDNTTRYGELLIQLNRLASTKQKQRFAKKLNTLIKDLTEMSEEI